MEQIRKIRRGGYRVTQTQDVKLGDDVKAWLLKQAKAYGLTTLLTHADDGVSWGKVTDDVLVTSHDVFGEPPSPKLRLETLQQARFFGEQAELLLWRTAKGWQARLAEDTPEGEHYDQSQLLWGDRRVDGRDGFTLVEEGQQGLRHAPPVDVPETEFLEAEKKLGEEKKKRRHPLHLLVRHYLATDPETGVVDVALSRLVKVEYEPFDVKKEVAS